MAGVPEPAAILAELLDAHPSLSAYLEAPVPSDETSPARSDETSPAALDQLQAAVVWMHAEPLLRGRRYRLRIGTETVMATVAPLRYRVNLESGERVAATKLERGEVGVCDLELSAAVAFTPYHDDPGRGMFLLIDPLSGRTLGAGAVRYGLRRAGNVPGQALTVDGPARAQRAGQTPCLLWFTGRPGAGKSTIANRVEAELHNSGRHTYLLDGDNVRRGLNRDLGFTDADRVENIRRVAEVARLMLDAGLIVLVSFISPFRSERGMARSLCAEHAFVEIFIDTPLAVAEARDPKGLYAKARRGELRNFTGIDSPYEPPESPELRIATTEVSADEAAACVIALLTERGLLPRA